jgi:hypothetical protein
MFNTPQWDYRISILRSQRTAVFLPRAPLQKSVPRPPFSASLPRWPNTLSLPRPPNTLSLPRRPQMRSLPRNLRIVSSAARPAVISGPAVPGGFDNRRERARALRRLDDDLLARPGTWRSVAQHGLAGEDPLDRAALIVRQRQRHGVGCRAAHRCAAEWGPIWSARCRRRMPSRTRPCCRRDRLSPNRRSWSESPLAGSAW